uniref:Nucleolar GTP-binding protein 1 n=1 Tax=Octactis speculum TaxID=3111310 RepID=A0A7S2BZF7_9STRA|mmetsp:Transcript_29281/g.39786  ORF Transcript_29281/g.39786 Transcript_29281/m.39786 type:complete len:653 (+) Transcript_29281:29-1987(+)|eukprot:CAMPEP_0185779418 /NCGR_PEP_ID=MMETSP1174-20130828/95774_1 /TAXON_ID=35687 /ORGANISM="Dictyocha speculum, Strain CCMP1381" /LENGTH=652 /DNA_ID=CAMNT_0028468571 /DNA_START=27 /DNA_END=1985 /DNA_ORIENTATION=+
MAGLTYNFKSIAPVPPADQFIDIVLTRTQRRTPTVVHPGYAINRIRAFYMRKVKYTQQTASERLGEILTSFPRLDDIHPFYADLMNILYDRDHYKLALGQINISKRLIDTLARDYVRLIKYGDSLYRCKQLKRAAMGRMMTILKRQKASLSYLEEVRKHLSRLPSIDPNTRTLIVCGYPNVGKSSFMNKVTRADVEVQPYAFTTKSLFVGHMDYRYLRWQVVDTPGILDHPLDERNTIEMQAITALAHLQCCVLYFLDISEQCGFTIAQQVALFENIKPLFANKQLLLIVNKIDVVAFDAISEDNRNLITEMVKTTGAELMHMSNVSEEGVSAVKNRACDLLLQARVDARVAGSKVQNILNRLTVTTPGQEGTNPPKAFIPESVVAARLNGGTSMDPSMRRKTEKDLMIEGGGPGVYKMDFNKNFLLSNDEWKYDAVPEIMDGKNVADFIDPDVQAKLDALDLEQEQVEAEAADAWASDESDLDDADKAILNAIRSKKKVLKKESRLAKSRHAAPMPRATRRRQMKDVVEHLEGVGVDSKLLEGNRASKTVGTKRGREESRNDGEDYMDEEESGDKRQRSQSRSRSMSARRASGKDLPVENPVTAKKMRKMQNGAKGFGKVRKAGEADRRSGPKLAKHLIAGKMSSGTRRSR